MESLKENMHHLRSRERDHAIRKYITASNQRVKNLSIDKEDTQEAETRKKKAHKFKVDLKKEAREREENIMKMVRERKANKVVEELQMSR